MRMNYGCYVSINGLPCEQLIAPNHIKLQIAAFVILKLHDICLARAKKKSSDVCDLERLQP